MIYTNKGSQIYSNYLTVKLTPETIKNRATRYEGQALEIEDIRDLDAGDSFHYKGEVHTIIATSGR